VGVLPTSDPGTILLPFLNVGAGSGTVNLDATLIGAVLNAPVNHILEYQVATASRFPLAGDASVEFTENIPSNEPFDVAVVARDPSDGRTTSAVFVHDVTAVSGEVLHLDFDFAQAVPFDRTVTVTYPNAPDGGSRAQLELFGAGEIVLARDDSPLPREQVLAWPDLSGPALVGFAPTFEVLANGFDTTFHNSTCVLPLEHVTPSALTVKLLGPPAIQSPVNQALFASYGPGARVAFTLGTGAGTPVGFNDVVFVGHAGAVGVFTFWEILMAPTQTRVTLPPVFPTKPMFDWGTHQVSVETARFDFPGFAFATFFDQDLPNRLAAIDAGPLCSARRLHTFGIDPTQRLVVPPELPHAPHVWRR
jgi:hypothetical protein